MYKLVRLILFLVVAIAMAVFAFGNGGKYPRPTQAYYVNDFANVLMAGTRATIVGEGERLYEMTLDEPEGGAQIVVATFAVTSVSEIADYDKTELFRKWRIGKNDMGVLVLLFFVEETVGDAASLDLAECQIEVGYRMEQYLTPAKLGRMVDDYLLNEDWDYLIDLGVVNLLYELLTEIYVGAYGYSSFNYDMEEYEEYLFNYEGDFDDDPVSMNLVLFLLSPFSSLWDKIGAILTLVLLAGFGGGSLVGNRGGGGSSGGMGIFRRRR